MELIIVCHINGDGLSTTGCEMSEDAEPVYYLYI
jgi:hypothetical protein